MKKVMGGPSTMEATCPEVHVLNVCKKRRTTHMCKQTRTPLTVNYSGKIGINENGCNTEGAVEIGSPDTIGRDDHEHVLKDGQPRGHDHWDKIKGSCVIGRNQSSFPVKCRHNIGIDAKIQCGGKHCQNWCC